MSGRPLLISCGILNKEVEFLMAARGWDWEVLFLKSSLHFDFEELEQGLNRALSSRGGERAVVLYGVCHPLIDRIVAGHRAVRVPCQNCVELLLGTERFTADLAQGAYFLLEEWARDWDAIMERTFGSLAMAREIFRSDRRLLVAVRTPCSGDFSAVAENIALSLGVPLKWVDADLGPLEAGIRAAMGAVQGGSP